MARLGRSFPARGITKNVAVQAAAAGSITGTANITLADVTLSSTGALAIAGTASITLGAVTLSATGAETITGTANITLGAVTLASTGTLPIVGTATPTLGNVTLSATGTIAIAGVASITIGAVTLSATGALPIVGTLAVTLDDVMLSATGTSGTIGTANITLDDVTLSATGTLTGTGEQHFQGAGSASRKDIKRLRKARRKMAEALERQLAALVGEVEEEAAEAEIAGVPPPEAPPLVAEARATMATLLKIPAREEPPFSVAYVQDLLTRMEDYIERQDEDEALLLLAA